MRSFATILLALSLPLHAFAIHGVNHRRHADIALQPRQGENARMTYYDITTGTTACGGNYGAGDFVVALNPDQFGSTPGGSPFCGKSITITCNGKSTGAVIVDKCPGCPGGGLDLTEGLFKFFAPLGTGVLSCSWDVGGGGAAHEDKPTSSPPPPSPTTHDPPPTTSQQSTSSPPPPSSSSSSTSTSTTSKTSSSVSSAAPTTTHQSSSSSTPTPTYPGVIYNNPPASSLAQPSGTISPGQNQSINAVYQGMIGLGTLVVALNP